MKTHTHTQKHTPTQTPTQRHTARHIPTRTQTLTHIHTNTHTNTHTHTHPHTHTMKALTTTETMSKIFFRNYAIIRSLRRSFTVHLFVLACICLCFCFIHYSKCLCGLLVECLYLTIWAFTFLKPQFWLLGSWDVTTASSSTNENKWKQLNHPPFFFKV